MGKAICQYQQVKHTDPKLQNLSNLERCIDQLRFLRLITQIILPKERLCWLVYNGLYDFTFCFVHSYLITVQHTPKLVLGQWQSWLSLP